MACNEFPGHPDTPAPPTVVLDTNVCLAVFAWVDPGCAALAAALRERRLRAVANAATREEWLRVLHRAELRLEDGMRARAAAAFAALVVDFDTEPVPASLSLPRCRDRDDQVFLELAHASGAIALFSRDRELLRLSRRTQRLAGFAVLRPDDFAG